MTEEAKFILEEIKESMQHALTHLEKEFHKFRTSKASPQMLEGVKVDYYGNPTSVDKIANINTPDARTIVVQPWEKNMLHPLAKAILDANLGFNPQNNGDILRISVPPLTEERRRDMVKKARAEGEAAKITIRNMRRNAVEEAKKLEKDGVSEDDTKVLEKEIQHITDSFIAQADKIIEHKEKDIMTV
jgi:ribosome recycling factor